MNPHMQDFGSSMPIASAAPDSCEVQDCRAGSVKESKIGGANAIGALDRFWPGRTISRSGAHLLPIAAKSGLPVRRLHGTTAVL